MRLKYVVRSKTGDIKDHLDVPNKVCHGPIYAYWDDMDYMKAEKELPPDEKFLMVLVKDMEKCIGRRYVINSATKIVEKLPPKVKV